MTDKLRFAIVLLFGFLLMKRNVHSWEVKTLHLSSWKLCNNGLNDGERSTFGYSCDTDSQTKVPCDSRRPRNRDDCFEMKVSVISSELNNQQDILDTIFSKYDADARIRRLSFLFPIEQKIEWTDFIDHYLETRPWLTINEYNYLHQLIAKDKDILSVDKYNENEESYLRLLGSIAYLPNRECQESAMLMVTRERIIHPGWAGVTVTLYLEHQQYSFGTTVLYLSGSNNPHYSTSFIDATDCPSTINRWECAFYRTSNCSIPSPITSCTENNCVTDFPSTDNFGAYFRNNKWVVNNGTVLSAISDEFHAPKTEKQKYYSKLDEKLPPISNIMVPIKNLPWKSMNKIPDSITFNRMRASTREVLYIHQYLLRFRRQYRQMITQTISSFDHLLLHLFRNHHPLHHSNEGVFKSTNNSSSIAHSIDDINKIKQYTGDPSGNQHGKRNLRNKGNSSLHNPSSLLFPSSPSSSVRVSPFARHMKISKEHASSILSHGSSPRCIAAHIRRGDRLPPQETANVTDFCQRLGRSGSDFGCNSIPFVQIRLQQIVDIARVLSYSLTHKNHLSKSPTEPLLTLFVATDDESWLQSEIKSMIEVPKYQHWNIIYLPFNMTFSIYDSSTSSKAVLNVTSDIDTEFQSRRGTKRGVHLMSTMPLVQRCEGFIGHFDSNAAFMFYRAMCARHVRPIIFSSDHQRHSASAGASYEAKSREAICPAMVDIRQGFKWLESIHEERLLEHESSMR